MASVVTPMQRLRLPLESRSLLHQADLCVANLSWSALCAISDLHIGSGSRSSRLLPSNIRSSRSLPCDHTNMGSSYRSNSAHMADIKGKGILYEDDDEPIKLTDHDVS
ncbi:hypothetical protein F2Q69_00012683 [Brassica cretica]|uniref:Uncharacterized protein n=1 Tax=Brassica cretica TaxID=69181 RepID=A0A8S9R1P6_BRACR|nr:hypothetical protein F2Q69_00012683 [Brassica cretica]